MGSVADHYDTLLAEHYSWMFGDFETRVADQKALLESLGVGGGGGAWAVDLGCGPGFQSLALAQLGYRVRAVDMSEKLLGELTSRAGGAAIECLRADMREIDAGLLSRAGLLTCMGDTLTHLDEPEEVSALFERLDENLAPEAVVILTFRDLTEELSGTERFIALRGDKDRIMTCFLEYEEDRVMVHDLVHLRGGEGWSLLKSCYPKLRLGGGQVADMLREAGFGIELLNTENGLVTIQAIKD